MTLIHIPYSFRPEDQIPQLPKTTTPDPRLPSPTLELSNGDMFPFLTATTFNVGCIAHSLAMACRFAFQPRTFYSVAQHSVLVSEIMEADGGDPLEGLLHDAPEFVMGDQATPIKYRLPDFKALDLDMDKRMRDYFNLPVTKSPECRRADKMAMFMEAYDLLPSKGYCMNDPDGVRQEAWDRRADFKTCHTPWEWRFAKVLFMARYEEVKHRD